MAGTSVRPSWRRHGPRLPTRGRWVTECPSQRAPTAASCNASAAGSSPCARPAERRGAAGCTRGKVLLQQGGGENTTHAIIGATSAQEVTPDEEFGRQLPLLFPDPDTFQSGRLQRT